MINLITLNRVQFIQLKQKQDRLKYKLEYNTKKALNYSQMYQKNGNSLPFSKKLPAHYYISVCFILVAITVIYLALHLLQCYINM